jgi:hypothetical protein
MWCCVVPMYQTAWHDIPQDCNLTIHCCENLKSMCTTTDIKTAESWSHVIRYMPTHQCYSLLFVRHHTHTDTNTNGPHLLRYTWCLGGDELVLGSLANSHGNVSHSNHNPKLHSERPKCHTAPSAAVRFPLALAGKQQVSSVPQSHYSWANSYKTRDM